MPTSDLSPVQHTSYLARPEGRVAYDVEGGGPLVVLVPGMATFEAATASSPLRCGRPVTALPAPTFAAMATAMPRSAPTATSRLPGDPLRSSSSSVAPRSSSATRWVPGPSACRRRAAGSRARPRAGWSFVRDPTRTPRNDCFSGRPWPDGQPSRGRRTCQSSMPGAGRPTGRGPRTGSSKACTDQDTQRPSLSRRGRATAPAAARLAEVEAPTLVVMGDKTPTSRILGPKQTGSRRHCVGRS